MFIRHQEEVTSGLQPIKRTLHLGHIELYRSDKIVDRIDLQVEIQPVAFHELASYGTLH